MKKILIIMALAISLATVASGQVVKDLVGRVTAAVSVGGSNYHCAFTSSYGYAHTSIAAGDEYAVRNGNDVVRYQVNSTTTVGVLPGYNIILNMSPMDGYGGSFPTAVAEVYRPTTNWGLSLVDPNVPVILQWGLVNKNFLEIDSLIGSIAPYGVFTGLISQTGTSDPTVTVLNSTIGALSFERDTNGVYNIVSGGLFVEDKTWIAPLKTSEAFGDDVNIEWISIDTIRLHTAFDGQLDGTKSFLEIRIYN